MLKKYHFIGIGGISMSALATFLYHDGNIVTGSDLNKIKLLNIDCSSRNKVKNVKNANVIVVNNAIPENNKELVLAKKLHKKIITRAKLLSQIAEKYKNVISITGTHGKTTTTEMIAEIFIEAGLNPTVHIGGISQKFNSNFLEGDKNFFITEACEYKDSFLTLKSKVGVITNIEPEHLDYFKTYKNEINSFNKFTNNCEKIIINNKKILKINKNKLNFNNYYIKNKKIIKNKIKFDVFKNNKFCFNIELNSIIEENIDNAILAINVAKMFNIKTKHIKTALENFCGTKRRMEVVSKSPTIYHDYAHHPTEIKTVIKSIKQHYRKKILVVFQPHTYSRTKLLFENFVASLSLADKVVLLKTFPAREQFDKNGDAKKLYLVLRKTKPNTEYFSTIKKSYHTIKHLTNQYITLILGAGDIVNLAEKFK